jgi:hypothetical protein
MMQTQSQTGFPDVESRRDPRPESLVTSPGILSRKRYLARRLVSGLNCLWGLLMILSTTSPVLPRVGFLEAAVFTSFLLLTGAAFCLAGYRLYTPRSRRLHYLVWAAATSSLILVISPWGLSYLGLFICLLILPLLWFSR